MFSSNFSPSACEKEAGSNLWIYVLVGNMLRGVGETPIMPLGISYLDDFSGEENAPFYLGLCVYLQSLTVFICLCLGKRWLILLIMSPSLPPSLSPTSLHPHSGNLRTRVWIYARVLPLQDLCGCWICGFRYGWSDLYFNLNCTVKMVKEACQTAVISHITEGT